MIDFTDVRAEVARQVADGTRPGVHLHVEIGGEPVLDLRSGDADPDRDQPVDGNTLFYTFSAVKAVFATAVVQLADRGAIALDDPIARHLPEFGTAGKDAITVRQLLTHRAGLPDGPGQTPAERLTWYYHVPLDQQIHDICTLAPEWPPGTAHGYHGLTLQPLCSALISRITDRPAADHIREHIFQPLGVDDFHLGLPEEHEPRVARLIDLTGGYPQPLIYNTREMHAWPGGGFTNAAQFARFYRGLLDAHLGRSKAVLSAAMARTMTFPHVAGYPDRRIGFDTPWGLGLFIKPPWSNMSEFNATGRGLPHDGMFGTLATPGTFGHGGNIYGSTAFADPGRDTVCVVMTNALLDHRRATDSFIAILDGVHRAIDHHPHP